MFSTGETEKVIESIMPHKWENDRKKSSTTASLRMDRKSSAGNRKSRKFRSISRSLMLCNAKNSDDGSSPDEKCPDPFEISTSWVQEDFDCCPSTQLPRTSETEDGPPDPPPVITSTIQSKAAANDNCNNMRRKPLAKVGSSAQYIVTFPLAVVPKRINPYFAATQRSTWLFQRLWACSVPAPYKEHANVWASPMRCWPPSCWTRGPLGRSPRVQASAAAALCLRYSIQLKRENRHYSEVRLEKCDTVRFHKPCK